MSTQRVNRILGYPVLFFWPVLALVLGLLVLGASRHIDALLASTVFILVLAGVSWLWSWQSLQKLSCQLSPPKSSVFPGEKVDLTFEVSNNKSLFLTWLEIELELPYRLATGKLKTLSPYIRDRLRWTTSISGGQRIRWVHSLECLARGDYRLGPVRLRSGDIFGLFPREVIMPHSERILVYPKIVPVAKLSLPLRELVGEIVSPKSIYEDTSQTMGARDYRHDDPLKRIHWKASARRSELQTRQYESTTSLSLLLMLDVHSFCYQQTDNEELFELAVTTVASLANEAWRKKFTMGLIANSVPDIQIPVRTGRSQLLLILEALARIEAKSQLPLQQQLNKYRGSLLLGTTLVIVSGDLSPSLISLVRQMEQEGHSVALVNVGEKIPVHNLRNTSVISVSSAGEVSQNFRTSKP